MLNKIGLPRFSIPTYSAPAFEIPGSVVAGGPYPPSAGTIENYQVFPLATKKQRLI
jgi:hypothetical protein